MHKGIIILKNQLLKQLNRQLLMEKIWFFLNTSEYNPFNSISGIQKTGKVIEKSSEIHFTHKLFPGLDQHSPSSEW